MGSRVPGTPGVFAYSKQRYVLREPVTSVTRWHYSRYGITFRAFLETFNVVKIPRDSKGYGKIPLYLENPVPYQTDLEQLFAIPIPSILPRTFGNPDPVQNSPVELGQIP